MDYTDETYEIADTIYDDYGEVLAANKRGMCILEKMQKNKEISEEQFTNISAVVSIKRLSDGNRDPISRKELILFIIK